MGDGCFQSGENSYISYNSYVVLASGTKLVLGNNVSISHFVRIYTSGFCTNSKIKHGLNVEKNGDIIIGDNVLIGSGCYICPNVTIGSNVVIGANSVVNKDIPGNGVYAGSPAKLVKTYEQG
jgi:maltose O-acetyltransferase